MFKDFNKKIQKRFQSISEEVLFLTDIDKDLLWDTYLKSFPPGTNELFRERTEHDCQCCKQFIRACGNAVSIVDGKFVSIWDIEINDHYQVVADAMSALVKSQPIKDVFLHYEPQLGTEYNLQILENGEIIKWEHFYFKLPSRHVVRNDIIGGKLSDMRSNKEVLKRSLEKITPNAAKTVLELIEQGALYRGEEHKSIVEALVDYQKEFTQTEEKDNYCWATSVRLRGASKIRNTVIGSLLVDISEGKTLDKAVKSFETKVAPSNYKRPTALITKSMISNAQAKVAELGIENSLSRRHAITEDLTINNILFADRSAKQAMNIFDELKNETPVTVKNLDKIDEVSIETFIENILPKAETIEVLFDNKHTGNLVSLVSPKDKNAMPIFKWGNNFSWSYQGEVTDSIKERVRKAGGDVTGVLRCSLSWFNGDDLDIHVIEPDGKHIHYGDKKSLSSGTLDVDMNADGVNTRSAVENITWSNKNRILEGKYKVWINNYTVRERNTDVGFDVEIEFGGITHTFHYPSAVRNNVDVAEFTFSKKDGIKFIKSLPSAQATKEVWGIHTNGFQKVSMVMHSPNHWDGNETGNKHYFFMIEDCKNDSPVRGFFNEFLKEDLREHRKVFEVLGSKMKIEKSDNQLSGLGFSSTIRNSFLCRVGGSFTRIIKINF